VSGNYYSLGETADLTSLSEKHVLKNKEKREQLGLKALLLPILSGGRKRRALGFPKILVDDYVAKHGRKPFPKNMDTPIAAAKRIECNVKTVIKWLEDGLLIGARVNSLKRPGPEVWAVDRNSAEEFRSLVKKYTARGVVPHLRQFGHRRQLEQPNAAGDRPGEANPKHLKWNEWYAGGKRKGGMSHQQVADRWFDETEEFVTADAVKKALKRL
jgi:hypothetical protein